MLRLTSIVPQTVILQVISSHASTVVNNGALLDFGYGSLSPSFCEDNSNIRWWSELSISEKQHCNLQGWTEDIWEQGWDWEELSAERQIYWISQGINQDEWEKENVAWEELSDERQQYYIQQNMTTDNWEKDMSWDEIPLERRQYYVDQGVSKDVWIKEWQWNELTDEQREHYNEKGWTEDAWNNDDKSLLNMYNEEELEWGDLSEDRRNYWIARGWDEEKWKATEIEDDSPQKISPLEVFNPVKIHLSIPELEVLDMQYLGGLKADVGLKDGTTLGDNESFHGPEMSLAKYIAAMKEEKTKLYFQLEDLDHYKDRFQSEIGDKIVEYLYGALLVSVLRDQGDLSALDFNDTDTDEKKLDWSLFVGGKNTTTSMHYDTDLFNFLWVVEGKKRVVMIPNNEDTKKRYKLQSAYSGSGWTGVDILSADYELPDDAVVMELGAGEGLMLPYLCWHAVQNLEATVAYGLRVKDD